MNSRRNRYPHAPQPSSPMDMFMASAEAGMASMRSKLNRTSEAEKMLQGTCSHCGKEGGSALKSCSRCKCVPVEQYFPSFEHLPTCLLEERRGTAIRHASSQTSRLVTSASAPTSPIRPRRVLFSSSRSQTSVSRSIRFLRMGTRIASDAGSVHKAGLIASTSVTPCCQL